MPAIDERLLKDGRAKEHSGTDGGGENAPGGGNKAIESESNDNASSKL